MTDRYEQGFRDAVERAAHQLCIGCQQSQPLEEREMIADDGSRKPYYVHQDPQGRFGRCSASEIRALTPGVWRNFLLSPQSMAAMFHEIHGRLAPKFGYRTRDSRDRAETQVNRYREALKHIALHCKDPDTRDEALKALAEGERFPLWEPAAWEPACELNRGLTIAVCDEILAKVGQKESHANPQS